MYDDIIPWGLAAGAIVVGLAALLYSFFREGKSRW
jgi:hypothetical protein